MVGGGDLEQLAGVGQQGFALGGDGVAGASRLVSRWMWIRQRWMGVSGHSAWSALRAPPAPSVVTRSGGAIGVSRAV